MRQILTVASEIQTELEAIQTCPATCEDGTIEVSPPSGMPQRRPCPLLSAGCLYGGSLRERLDEYLNRLLIDAGIPKRHVGHFDAYIETPAVIWTNMWNFHGFLVLSGKSGVGKSFGAAWAVKRYLKSRIPDLLDTNTWSRAAHAGENTVWTTANQVIRDKNVILPSRSACLLVLDDLGREGDFSTRRADVSDIISARYDAKLPTIVTTELAFNEIIDIYGQNTAFKLTEDVQGEGKGGMFIDCGDVSLRQDVDDVFDFAEKSVQWEPKK